MPKEDTNRTNGSVLHEFDCTHDPCRCPEQSAADATEARFQAVEDEARRIIDYIAPVEWDVHVWTDGPTPGRLDKADALRLVKRVLSLRNQAYLDRERDEADLNGTMDRGDSDGG